MTPSWAGVSYLMQIIADGVLLLVCPVPSPPPKQQASTALARRTSILGG